MLFQTVPCLQSAATCENVPVQSLQTQDKPTSDGRVEFHGEGTVEQNLHTGYTFYCIVFKILMLLYHIRYKCTTHFTLLHTRYTVYCIIYKTLFTVLYMRHLFYCIIYKTLILQYYIQDIYFILLYTRYTFYCIICGSLDDLRFSQWWRFK
jgi:hypothetical protein